MGEPQRVKGGGFSRILIAALLLPTAYVLSVGPISRLTWDHRFPFEAWEAAYQPLTAAAERMPKVEGALTWYVQLWGAPYFPPHIYLCPE